MENLFNQFTKIYVRLTPTNTGWKKETSVDKKVWVVENLNLTLDQVMKIKLQVIEDNFRNLHSIINKN
jgi:hypothetical protein